MLKSLHEADPERFPRLEAVLLSTRKPEIIDAQFNGWWSDFNIQTAFASKEAKELETLNSIFLT